jgi:GNAT superfamily N-acetyltransferase
MKCVKIGLDRIPEAHALAVRGAERIARDFGPGHWSRASSLRAWKGHIGLKDVYLAEQGGRAVAVFKLRAKKPHWVPKKRFAEPDARCLWLTDFYVDPDHLRRGIGRACMEEVRRIAAKAGCRWVRFDAYDAAAGAGAFYEKCGCVMVDRTALRGVKLLIFELRAEDR